MELESLFFELIRVAIGTQDSLSWIPTESEWEQLYQMAVKQSLVGVCFAGLQNLGADSEGGFEQIGMSAAQYMNWMAMAAQIQERNEVLNGQCIELQARLAEAGMRSCIIKGQANYSNYDGLAMLRQPGDIDVWVEGGRKRVLELVDGLCPTKEVRETHAQLHIFKDTEVEVHYRPGLIRDFLRNNKLQTFFQANSEECFTHNLELPCGVIVAPTNRFNAVQQMMHIYHHLFDSGIGLRQIMDYYFVLTHLPENDKEPVMDIIQSVGARRFARALMYVEKRIFDINDRCLLCEPSEKDGEYMLGEIMLAGNFGHYDSRRKRHSGSRSGKPSGPSSKNRSGKHSFLRSFFGVWFKNFHHLRFAPMEWFWSPLWRLYYFAWRKWNGYE